ncbi:MAG: hypothetical protein IMF10_06880, partial [Proteobacteria bacterium]|nr:hypothetical protein [Pseudomonadota bacterium]
MASDDQLGRQMPGRIPDEPEKEREKKGQKDEVFFHSLIITGKKYDLHLHRPIRRRAIQEY